MKRTLTVFVAVLALFGSTGLGGTANGTTGGAVIVNFVRLKLGAPYRFGKAGPNDFDCSGLVQAAYSRVGVNLPHSAARQFRILRDETFAHAQPGDVVAFVSRGSAYHVGILYNKATRTMIVAPTTGGHVEVQSYTWGGPSVRFVYSTTVHP